LKRPARSRDAAPRSGTWSGHSCEEATNPEAPFRGKGALTARHGPQRNPSSIALEGKGGHRDAVALTDGCLP